MNLKNFDFDLVYSFDRTMGQIECKLMTEEFQDSPWCNSKNEDCKKHDVFLEYTLKEIFFYFSIAFFIFIARKYRFFLEFGLGYCFLVNYFGYVKEESFLVDICWQIYLHWYILSSAHFILKIRIFISCFEFTNLYILFLDSVIPLWSSILLSKTLPSQGLGVRGMC